MELTYSKTFQERNISAENPGYLVVLRIHLPHYKKTFNIFYMHQWLHFQDS